MKKWIIAAAGGLAALVLTLTLTAQARRAQAAEHTLAETVLASVANAAEELQAMSIAMDKLPLATSETQTVSLLYQIVLSADHARHSLAALPGAPQQQASALRYLSRLSARAGELLTRMAGSRPVTTGELDDLAASNTELRLLHAELSLAEQALLAGRTLADALPPTDMAPATTAAELAQYRALPSASIGTGAAMQLAKEFVGEDRVTGVSLAPGTTGAAPTFGVTVQTADVQLNLEVSQRGGKVLMMVPESAGFQMKKDVSECQQSAAEFLSAQGFASMTPTWYQVYEGLCVVTFVHVQEDALVWPDRVLVQVRMDTAEIVGIEASSYWKNHIPRKLGKPLVSAQEARSAISPLAQEQSVRLAVLPSGGQERLCWQFTLTHNDETYISFVDALTGQELLLEKVMQLEYGAIPA